MIVSALLLLAGVLGIAGAPEAVVKLQKNVKQAVHNIDNINLKIFCYDGEKSWSRIWSSLEFTVNAKAEEFTLHIGDNASVLAEQFGTNWWLELFSTREVTYQKRIMVPPYGMSCVGLKYHGTLNTFTCSVILKETVISGKFPLILIIGVTLLLSAYRMSRSVSFHYTTGIAIGIIASLLVLIYIVSKLVPGKPTAYAVMIGGWGVVAWAISEMKAQLIPMITSYPHYIIIYVVLVGVASFLFCYWWGPVTHPRTFQIIQWSIQLVAMTLIYHATQLREASLILLITVFIFYQIYHRLSRWIKNCYLHHVLMRWYVMFPPKRKLLTQREYKEEGVRETAAALQELREFCRQNDGDTYKLMAKLKSPNRFSKFLDGNFHLTDSEVQEYHCSSHDSDNDDEI